MKRNIYILITELNDPEGCALYYSRPSEPAVVFSFDDQANCGRGEMVAKLDGATLFWRYLRPSSFGPGINDYRCSDVLTIGDIADAEIIINKRRKED